MSRARSVGRWAELSLSALDESAASAREFHAIADVRADAYGHGLESVLRRIDHVGFEAFLVSPGAAIAGLRTPVQTTAPSDRSVLTGAELFGIAPGARAVLRVGAEILAVKSVAKGEGVSYGYTYVTPRDTRLALVGAGYAHGIVRRASNRAQVAVRSLQRTIVGSISMDQCTVDLDGADAAEGDDVVFFGDAGRAEPTLLEWQQQTGIRALAITARLGAHFERRIA